MLRRLTNYNQAGDTIVEVMVSVVVAGMALGAAYAISGASLRRGIEAQERTQATRLVQSQIEYLKSANITTQLPSDGIESCYQAAQSPPVGGRCLVIDGKFDIWLVRNGNTYTIRAEWDSLNGGSRNLVRMDYRR